MTVKEMEKLLKADGWVLKGTVGSHAQYVHPEKKRKGNFAGPQRRYT